MVEYNPSDHDDRFPAPPVTLLHELSHAYNIVTGTMQRDDNGLPGDDLGTPRSEMQAAGLTNDGANFKFPGGSGPSTVNPVNENSFRDELGLPQRPSYSMPPTWDGGLGSPLAMAPAGGGATPVASTGDAALDRMLAAMQSGDAQGLKQASASLYDQNAGQFKEQGAADWARQQADVKPQQIAPPQVGQPQAEQPEAEVADRWRLGHGTPTLRPSVAAMARVVTRPSRPANFIGDSPASVPWARRNETSARINLAPAGISRAATMLFFWKRR